MLLPPLTRSRPPLAPARALIHNPPYRLRPVSPLLAGHRVTLPTQCQKCQNGHWHWRALLLRGRWS